MSVNDTIYAALQARVEAHPFPRVTFDSSDNRTTSRCDFMEPQSIVIDEDRLLAAEGAPNQRAGRPLEASESTWLMTLKFDRRVSLESFEASMLDSPPIVPRSGSLDRQIWLLLEQAVAYKHPPHHEPASGSKVTYRIRADYTPR